MPATATERDADRLHESNGTELQQLRDENERLRSRLIAAEQIGNAFKRAARLAQRAGQALLRSEELKAEGAAYKKQADQLQAEARRVLLDAKNGQLTIPVDEDDADEPVAEGNAGDTPIEDMAGTVDGKTWKIPAGTLAKLAEQDVRTVAQLEAFIADGKLVPGAVKGVGQAAIDKISDALVSFRGEHPVPQGEPEQEA